MKAKNIIGEYKERDSLFGGYTTWYVFECIECGKHYKHFRGDARNSPLCYECRQKHRTQKAKERVEKRKQNEIREVILKIKSEIYNLKQSHMIGNVSNESLIDTVIEIIDKNGGK